MNLADSAISKMRPPKNMHIICIDVTNKCDLACSNCTRLLENQDAFWEMTPENFRLALQSLKDFHGIIAMIGGNPVMHRNFEELCAIFEEEIPNKFQRGLWTNSIFKHTDLALRTFGTFNLNVHGNPKSERSMQELAKQAVDAGAVVWNYAGHSDHAPLLTAIQDLMSEEEMWQAIPQCDINREWSASIVQNQGELRSYFCEVAAAFDLARNQDRGHAVKPGWWKEEMQTWSDQVKHFCPGCGVAAKQSPHKDFEEIDVYTETNRDLAEKSTKDKKRKIIYLQPENSSMINRRVTQYNTL